MRGKAAAASAIRFKTLMMIATLRLCAKGDRKGAVAALREHILATGETIIRRLAQR
jgi:DNA-binding GntR family transcriptional regulator